MSTSWARRVLVRVLVPVVLLAGAAYCARWAGFFRPAVFPYPHDVVSQGLMVVSNPQSLTAIGVTLRRLAVVFLIALAIGGGMAILFYQVRVLAEIFALPVDIIRSIPVVTLFPLFIALWGFSETTFLAVPVVLTSVIIYIYLSSGLRTVSPVRRRLMQRWGASRGEMIVHLLVPTVAPHLFTALRVCVSLQLILVLVAEMFLGAQQGLGTLIYDYQTVLRYEEMYFFIAVAGLLGWIVNWALETAEAKIVYWKEQSV